MITYEGITEVNAGLPRMDIKGKKYSIVAARVQGFRKLCPDGMIKTEIVSIDESRVVMTATIADADGKVLATGTAFEEKGSSYINKTSYVENCETSAVGRALAMLGIGSEENLCSADELMNALNGQKRKSAEEVRLIGQIKALMMSKGYAVTAKAEAQLEDMDKAALVAALNSTKELPVKEQEVNLE